MRSKDKELNAIVNNLNKRAQKGRIKRLKYLMKHENENKCPFSPLTFEYYMEARLCWYVGSFVASIIMTQLAFEELLRSYYRMAKSVAGKLENGKKVDDAGFYELINQSKNDKFIENKESYMLNRLRKNIRNPYVHTKDMKQPNNFTQYLKLQASESINIDVEKESKWAIKLLLTTLPEISYRMYVGK